MNTAEMRSFVESLESGDRAKLFGILLDATDQGPDDSDENSVSEAIARRDEVDSGDVEMLDEETFWRGLRKG